MEFDQSEFFANLPGVVDMDSIGYVYVPSNCQNKTVGRQYTVIIIISLASSLWGNTWGNLESILNSLQAEHCVPWM